MLGTISRKIEFEDFSFEHSITRITANRATPVIKLGGLDIGPFEEGNEYEVYYWVASELEKSGIVRLHLKEQVDVASLNKIQWTERIQTPSQISRLPEDFYPKLRRCLVELKMQIVKNPEKMREYERVVHLTQDIINSRLKKIISIASAPAQTENTLRNLSGEEKFLYERLFKVINEWKTQILEQRGESK
jgi:hypothetical protein